MEESESVFKHVKCGGNIRRNAEGRYVCDRCRAEGKDVVSSAEKVEGKPEDVSICDSNDEPF